LASTAGIVAGMNEPAPFPELPPEVQLYIRDLESRNAQLSARVRQLEEQFRLAQLKRYAPSSENPLCQYNLRHLPD
jgi:transposase